MNELRRIASAGASLAAGDLPQGQHFQDILQARLSRRQALLGAMSATTWAVLGSAGLVACSDDDNSGSDDPDLPNPTALGFDAVAKNQLDVVTVPAGYTASAIYRLGDPITAAAAAFANNGSDAGYDQRAGDHHDGMYYFGLNASGGADRKGSDRGLLVMNHENITQVFLHPNGPTPAPRPEAEARKEIDCHGVSIIEVKKGASGFAYVPGSTFNRRITPQTEMDLSGPVRGTDHVKTRYSTDGTKTRGTINNCANGYTPWGTYLTCEENWPGYFKRVAGDDALRSAAEVAQLKRAGVTSTSGSYQWSTVTAANPADTSFSRWNASVTGASALEDFRNEPNTYGYIVEIDPYDGSKRPKKRTALGRFGHEGAWPAAAVAGQPIVFYMGDDNRGDYIYKFVSSANWDPADADKGLAAGDKYMDAGVLYVAKYNADGTGQWIALVQGSNGLTATNALYPFATQADVIIATRLAGDAVGATKMDRPEWGAVNPLNGEVYFTLTNNSNRGVNPAQPVDAINPRSYTDLKGAAEQKGNVNGHVIRWKEDGAMASATTFKWDVYLFGAQSDADPANINLSALTADNDLSSPDGLWFSPASGLLWIQTDDGAYTDVTNCMMLAAVAGTQGDGAAASVVAGTTTVQTYVGKAPGAKLARFLVGPKGCELTGIAETPDGKTLFVNIQHPGEDTSAAALADPTLFQSHWPDGGSARPRSSTVAITRTDGGVIGV